MIFTTTDIIIMVILAIGLYVAIIIELINYAKLKIKKLRLLVIEKLYNTGECSKSEADKNIKDYVKLILKEKCISGYFKKYKEECKIYENILADNYDELT